MPVPGRATALVFLLGVGALIVPWLIDDTPASAEDGVLVLRAGHTSNVDEPYHQGLLEFARIVAERSDGRVRIDVFPSSQLGNERMMLEGVLLGTLDIVVTANGSATGFVPLLGVLDLPYLFRDRQHMYRVLDGGVGEALRAAAVERGFRILGFLDAGVRHIMTAEQPVESYADLQGLKIRTMGVPAHLASFKAFGAQAVAINYGEVYGSLQTGLIDGAEAANTNFTRQKFYEVAPHWAQVGWIILVANMMMGEDAFRALPPEVRKILLDASEIAARHERRLYRESDEALLATIVENGVTVTRPDVAPFRAAARRVHGEMVTSRKGLALLEAIHRDDSD